MKIDNNTGIWIFRIIILIAFIVSLIIPWDIGEVSTGLFLLMLARY